MAAKGFCKLAGVVEKLKLGAATLEKELEGNMLVVCSMGLPESVIPKDRTCGFNEEFDEVAMGLESAVGAKERLSFEFGLGNCGLPEFTAASLSLEAGAEKLNDREGGIEPKEYEVFRGSVAGKLSVPLEARFSWGAGSFGAGAVKLNRGTGGFIGTLIPFVTVLDFSVNCSNLDSLVVDAGEISLPLVSTVGVAVNVGVVDGATVFSVITVPTDAGTLTVLTTEDATSCCFSFVASSSLATLSAATLFCLAARSLAIAAASISSLSNCE